MRLLSLIASCGFLVSQLAALKVLMAGDMDKDRREWFTSVADRLSTNEATANVVYMLAPDLPLNKVEKVSERLFKWGIGEGHDFTWASQKPEMDNLKAFDLAAARAFFQQEALLSELKKAEFDLGVGGLYYADSLLFRELGVQYLKLSEEDVESYTMQHNLNMPVLTSSYPSKQVWSLFDHMAIPDMAELGYRIKTFFLYQLNKYENYKMRAEMKAILGAKRTPLVDDFDQDHTMVIGQGTRAGLYQAIMMKPPNVRYVYPLTRDRTPVTIPDFLASREGLVIFNMETGRADDLLAEREQFANVKMLIDETLRKDIGVVVLAPAATVATLRERFSAEEGARLWLVETDSPHDLKLVNARRSDQLNVWVGTCSQANFISGIAEHKAVFVGYAEGMGATSPNTQKYNCHKVSEFMVGVAAKKEGPSSSLFVSFFEGLLDRELNANVEVRKRTEFYSEILLAERDSKMDLEYWMDYVHEFGVSHKVPLYDHMSWFKYHNVEVWSLFALILYILYKLVRGLISLVCWLACCCCKKSDAAKTKTE